MMKFARASDIQRQCRVPRLVQKSQTNISKKCSPGLLCHFAGKHIMKLPDGSFICKYRGKYYAFGQSWIDPTRCLQCICLGASGIACCKM